MRTDMSIGHCEPGKASSPPQRKALQKKVKLLGNNDMGVAAFREIEGKVVGPSVKAGEKLAIPVRLTLGA